MNLICPVCGYGNRPGASVCEDCGLLIPQYQACAACGFMNTADSRFCGNCGSAFGAAPQGPPFAERAVALAPAPPAPQQGTAPVAFPPPTPPATVLPSGPVLRDPAVFQNPGPPPPPRALHGPGPESPASAPAVDPLVGRPVAEPAPPGRGLTFRLVHDGTGVEIRLPLQDAALVVGRPGGDPDVDVSGFPDATVVSRKHARISISGGRLAVEDLESANGTYVNNVRIRGAAPLADGDRIAFGQGAKVVFTLRLGSPG